MIAYASWTGTRRNLDGLRAAGWRLLTGPHIMKRNGWKPPAWTDGSIAPFCLDNGAWTCHQSGESFNSHAFERAVSIAGEAADWIVVPDIVEGGLDSLAFSLDWLPRLDRYRVLLAVQDGMEPADIRPYLSGRVGIFVGGSTDWKLGSCWNWGELSRDIGCHFHVARVNTARRIRLCQYVRADSFDGSGVSKFFFEKMPRLAAQLKQTTIWDRL